MKQYGSSSFTTRASTAALAPSHGSDNIGGRGGHGTDAVVVAADTVAAGSATVGATHLLHRFGQHKMLAAAIRRNGAQRIVAVGRAAARCSTRSTHSYVAMLILHRSRALIEATLLLADE